MIKNKITINIFNIISVAQTTNKNYFKHLKLTPKLEAVWTTWYPVCSASPPVPLPRRRPSTTSSATSSRSPRTQTKATRSTPTKAPPTRSIPTRSLTTRTRSTPVPITTTASACRTTSARTARSSTTVSVSSTLGEQWWGWKFRLVYCKSIRFFFFFFQ